jgi:hypothetical protein
MNDIIIGDLYCPWEWLYNLSTELMIEEKGDFIIYVS